MEIPSWVTDVAYASKEQQNLSEGSIEENLRLRCSLLLKIHRLGSFLLILTFALVLFFFLFLFLLEVSFVSRSDSTLFDRFWQRDYRPQISWMPFEDQLDTWFCCLGIMPIVTFSVWLTLRTKEKFLLRDAKTAYNRTARSVQNRERPALVSCELQENTPLSWKAHVNRAGLCSTTARVEEALAEYRTAHKMCPEEKTRKMIEMLISRLEARGIADTHERS